MAEPKSMKIISICKIVPADPPSQFTLPLTFFDRFYLQNNRASRVFFYKFSDPNTDFYYTILPKLERSLSLTLKHYLPLAGNLIWPHDSDLPVVQYNDGDGVSLTIAETEADFDYLSGDVFRETAELRSLVPNGVSSETIIPAMTMQITIFQTRGLSIGYVLHHAVMDGKSTSMFLHAWAYICNKGDVFGLPHEFTPSYDRTFVQHHKELEKVFPKGFRPMDLKSKSLPALDTTPYSTMLGTFKLTRKDIEALKNQVKTKSNHAWVSSFTVASAYVTICLTKAKKVTADTVTIGIVVDGRLRLDPPPLSTYFGNCLLFTKCNSDTTDFLAEDGFINAVNVIIDALANLNKGILSETKSVIRYIASAKNFQLFTIGGSPRFEIYKVDFGWGKPVKVEMISIDGGRAFALSDDREDNGGIEIGIVLEKHETEAFATVFANGIQVR